ncbi:MAG: FG-GAP repeat domain-containing protein, partial [Bacteroidia bacterium]
MKKLLIPLLLMLGCASLSAQTLIDHPIDLVNSSVEANEFLIFHTDGLGSSSPATKTTIGRYDPAGGSLSQKIVEASSVTNPASVQTGNGKFMNAIALDYNGDSYDEVVYVVEAANGVKGLSVPSINKGNLNGTINTGDVVTTLPTPSGSPMSVVKMDKGDFDNDGKEELILLTRSDVTNALRVQIRNILGPSTVQSSTLQKEASVLPFVPLSNSAYEAFDIAVGDFDKDEKLDLAVVAFEQGTSNRQCVLQYYSVTPPDFPSRPFWTIDPKGKVTLGTTGPSSGIENVAITSARRATGIDQVTVALAFRDPNNQNTIQRRLYTVITDMVPGTYDLDTPQLLAQPYTSSSNNGGTIPAISIDAGDLINNGEEEIAVAWDGEVQIFSSFSSSITLRATGSAGTVQDEFYKLTKGNSYLSIGDVDYDKSKDILVVTTDDDGNSGNTMHSMRVSIMSLSQNLQTLSVKAQKEIQSQQWAGASSDYHLCATLGEFQGGRAILKEPTKSLKKVFTPLIVNNAPPHHFDILDNVEADILDAYPNWPSTAGTGTISSQYLAVNNTSRTLETSLNSDWGVSSTLSVGVSKLGNGIKASVTGKYGEKFTKTQTNTSTVTISTLSTALSDDQVYGVVQDYEVFEYPVDSSGHTIGYVLAMMREGQPIIQWMDSKSTDAIDYISDHEPGNLFSYPSSANFDDYAGVSELIRKGTSKNIGNGGSLDFTMAFSDFTSSSASVTKEFGVEVNVAANASFKFVDVGLDVTGSYNQSEMTTHSSTAYSEVSYTSDLSRALNPQFSDAFYTVTPHVYKKKSGALTLGYAVDPSLPTGGLDNFWSDNYNTHPDLTM